MDPGDLSEACVAEMISGVAAYMRQEGNLYFCASELLTPEWRTAVQPYFLRTLLDAVSTVILKGARIPPPPFYAEAIVLNSGHFPDFVSGFRHLLGHSVFHDEIAPRTLFHGLVHAAQMALLGMYRYAELFVRRFVKTRAWMAIPLEAQAYQLDSRFAMPSTAIFSVEDEVKSWAEQGRY
jgi:hypothetical protein